MSSGGVGGPIGGVSTVESGGLSGGVCWAGGTTAAVYYLGMVAERWLKGFSWAGLAAAALFGLGITVYVKRRMTRGPAAETTPEAETAGGGGQRSMSVTSSE